LTAELVSEQFEVEPVNVGHACVVGEPEPELIVTQRSTLVRTLSPMRDFLRAEAAGGVLLVVAALAALVWANSPLQNSYESLWTTEVSLRVGTRALNLDVRHWVNEALMTIFFLVVGLEIKRELTTGHLSNRRSAALPFFAAIGGMVVPALAYLLIAGATDSRGWAVPMATDIALAVGVVTVLGARVSAPQRTSLLGLAIVDDIGAIVIIALVFSAGISAVWLGVAVVMLLTAIAARAAGITAVLIYCALGASLWFALHEAGLHPTLAGVAMGLLAPSTPRLTPDLIDIEELTDLSTVEHVRSTAAMARSSVSVVEWLEHVLHPWTSYVIVPLFALANAGIVVSADVVSDAVNSPVAWGIFVGLVVGKPVGVVAASLTATRTGFAELPPATGRRELVGIGSAAGIGFTVALFVADLAFDEPVRVGEAKLAILAASILSALIAWCFFGIGRGSHLGQQNPADTR
jgi:Na+:H+ antiporter, NhaA family